MPPAVRPCLDFGGPAGDGRGRRPCQRVTWAAVVWQAVGNTMFGYGVWGWLLARYPAATVAPLALLVPVFGMTSAAVLLGEPLPGWKLGAAALVMSGWCSACSGRASAAFRTRPGRTGLAQRAIRHLFYVPYSTWLSCVLLAALGGFALTASEGAANAQPEQAQAQDRS